MDAYMMLCYEGLSQKTLVDLCALSGIRTVGKTRNQLICALMGDDAKQRFMARKLYKDVSPEDSMERRDRVPGPSRHRKSLHELFLSSETAIQILGTDDPNWYLQALLESQEWDREKELERAQIKGKSVSLQSSASRSPRARSTAIETQKCFLCKQVGHLTGHCPTLRWPSPTSATRASPTVCVGEEVGGRADNLQPVTVGNSVTVGLRDTGSEDILAHPGKESLEDVIPEEAKVITGVGEVTPTVPVVCVVLNRESVSHLSEVGISDPTDGGGRVDNLQSVTTSTNVFVGLRELGSEDILACPGLESCEDVIPEEAMIVADVGGVIPGVHMACVYLPPERGSNVLEVGIPKPTVLMGADPGMSVAQIESYLTPLKPTSLPEAPDSPPVLFEDSGHMRNSGVGHGDKDCVPGPGPSESLEPRSGAELNVMMDCNNAKVKNDVLYNNMCGADAPSAVVETRSAHQSSSDWPLPTATEELSAGEADQARSPIEPGPEGLKSLPPVISLVSVADSSESLEAVKSDSSLEELRGLADGPSVEDDRVKIYGERSFDAAIIVEEHESGSEIFFANENCVLGERGEDKQCVSLNSCGIESDVTFSSVTTVTITAIAVSVLCATEGELQGYGTDLTQDESTPSAVAADSNEFLQAGTCDARPQKLRCCTDRPSAEEDGVEVWETCRWAEVLVFMPVSELKATREWPYPRPKHLDAVADKVPPDGQGQWRRMMTAHNDRFACVLPECSLWPVDEVDPRGDPLANCDPDPLGSIREGCGNPLLSAREQADMSAVLEFQMEPLPPNQRNLRCRRVSRTV